MVYALLPDRKAPTYVYLFDVLSQQEQQQLMMAPIAEHSINYHYAQNSP